MAPKAKEQLFQHIEPDLKEVVTRMDKDQAKGYVLELYQEMFGRAPAPILSPNELSKQLYELYKRLCVRYTRKRKRDFENAMRAEYYGLNKK